MYRCLREAEHRSTAFIPYWQVPGLAGPNSPLEGQRKFASDLELLNAKLDECIAKVRAAVSTSLLLLFLLFASRKAEGRASGTRGLWRCSCPHAGEA